MATRQNRLPGVKWGEFNTKQRTRSAPLSGTPTTQPQGAGVPGGNPNNSSSQFNRSAVIKALQTGVESAMRSQYFRNRGFGPALRYTLGMEQTPSHVQDYLNARTHGQRRTGVHPGPLYAQAQEPEA